MNLALIGSIMIRHDRGSLFFGLILPHGLLELTAVFVAAGVGPAAVLVLGVTGNRTRGQSLAAEGRSAGGVAIGLAVVLLVSGVIEAFVTPSGLPTWARIAIGVAAEIAFLAYVYGPGRRAVRNGWTGDIDDSLLEAKVATRRLERRSEESPRLEREVVVGQAHRQVVRVRVEDLDTQRREQPGSAVALGARLLGGRGGVRRPGVAAVSREPVDLRVAHRCQQHPVPCRERSDEGEQPTLDRGRLQRREEYDERPLPAQRVDGPDQPAPVGLGEHGL